MGKKNKSGIDQKLLIKIGVGLLVVGGVYYGINSIGDAPPPGPVINTTAGTSAPSAVAPVNRPVVPVGGGAPPAANATTSPPAKMLIAEGPVDPPEHETVDDSAAEASPRPNPGMTPGLSVPPNDNNPATGIDGQTPTVSGVLEKVIGPAGMAIVGQLFNSPAKVVPSQQAVARISARSESGITEGIAFVAAEGGILVTNYHTVVGAKQIELTFSNGKKTEILGVKHIDPLLDLAILQVSIPEGATPFPVLKLSDNLPEAGQNIQRMTDSSETETSVPKEGAITAVLDTTQMQAQAGFPVSGNWLQVTLPILEGQCGCPLLNSRGEVAGIGTLQLAIGQNQFYALSAPDIVQSLQAAGNRTAEPLETMKWQEMDPMLQRQLASHLEETERGNELLAKADKIAIVVNYQEPGLDPTGRTCETVYLHAEQAFKKADVKVTYGEPASDQETGSVLIVRLITKPSRDTSPDARMLAMEAVLICPDPQSSTNNKLARVWSVKETDLGNVALSAISAGQLSRSIWTDLTSFFNKFRTSRMRAARAVGL